MDMQRYIRLAADLSRRHATATQRDLLRLARDHVKELVDPYPYRRYTRAHRCIFVHIPKAAGTSMLRAFGYHGPRDHCTYREYQKANPSRFDRYFKFTVVRDPVTRFLSTYGYIRRGGNRTGDLRLAEVVNAACRSPADFVSLAQERDLCACWPMMWPQAAYIADESGTVMVDDVLRLESLAHDFERVRRRLGLRARIGHENRSSTRSPLDDLSSSERDRVERFVKRAYAVDYRVIGFPA